MYKNITSAAKQYKEQFDYFQLTAQLLSNSKHVFALNVEQRQRYATQTHGQMIVVMEAFRSLNHMVDAYLSYISPVLESMMNNQKQLLERLDETIKRYKVAKRTSSKLKRKLTDEINQLTACYEQQQCVVAAFLGAVNIDTIDSMAEGQRRVESELESVSDTMDQLEDLQGDMREVKVKAHSLQKTIKKSVIALERTLCVLSSIFEVGGIGLYAGVTLDNEKQVRLSLHQLAAGYKLNSSMRQSTYCFPLEILHQQLNQISEALALKSVTPRVLMRKMCAIAEIFNQLHGRSISKADFSSLNNAECQRFYAEVDRLGGFSVYLRYLSDRVIQLSRSNAGVESQSDAELEQLKKVTDLFIQYVTLSTCHPDSPMLPYLKRMGVMFNVVKKRYSELRPAIALYRKNYKTARAYVDDVIERTFVKVGL